MQIFKDRRLFALFFSTLLVFTSFTSFFPVLPIYLKNIGATNFLVGIVMSAFPIGVLVFRPVVSWSLNKKGRRWTLLIGTIALTLSTSLYLLVSNPYSIIFVRFFHGIGISAFTTASIVLISDITTHENRGSIMGVMGVANYVGFGVGPFLAGQLYQRFSFSTVILFTFITALFSVIMLLLLPPDEKHDLKIKTKLSFAKTISQRWIVVPSIFIFIASLVQGSIVMFMPVFVKEVAHLDSGSFFLFFSFAVLFIRILAGKAADSFGRGIVLFCASIIISMAVIALWQTTNYAMLILAASLYGIGYGAQQPTMSAYVADNTSYSDRSTIFGFYYSVFDIGILSAGYIFGFIADTFSIQHIYPVVLAIYFLAIIVFITQIQSNVKNSIRWVFTARSVGRVCKLCNNQIGVDPCHMCGHRGGFKK